MTRVSFDYLRQQSGGASCVSQAWARVPEQPAPHERAALLQSLTERLRSGEAVLIAHYYTDGDLQDLALASGGCVADSLEMARFGRDHPAQTLIVAGVRFMGETAKILSPWKPPAPWTWVARPMTSRAIAMPTPTAPSSSTPTPARP